MKNQEFLEQLKERLVKEFNHFEEGGNNIRFYNQELNEKDNWGYTKLNGLIAHLEETYRHNGTKENVSCEVNFIKWEIKSLCSVGRTIKWIKIRQGASERQINNFVKKVVDTYKELESQEG